MARVATEPMDEFAKFDTGVPFVWVKWNRKSASVSWSDGTMWDYHEFDRAVTESGLDGEITAL